MIFTFAFIEELKAGAIRATRTAIPSKTLKNALTATYWHSPKLHQIIVNIPHYWAIYYHDGSGPITMPKGKYMVWFRNPEDDPRLKSGFPVKRSDVRGLNLSSKQFNRYIKEGKLIVRRHVGRRRAHPFTAEAYRLWAPWVRKQLIKAVQQEILDVFQPLKNIQKI